MLLADSYLLQARLTDKYTDNDSFFYLEHAMDMYEKILDDCVFVNTTDLAHVLFRIGEAMDFYEGREYKDWKMKYYKTAEIIMNEIHFTG